MAHHVSIATALDKNRIASTVVYLLLLEVDIIDPNNGNVVETLYCVNNNEPVTFRGFEYTAIPFQIELTQEKEKSPTATLTVVDVTQSFQAALQAYGGSLDWPARFKVINVDNPSPTIEIEQDFQLLSAIAKDQNYAISFTLGAENPLTLRFPPRQQYRARCFWKYRGTECGYTGSISSCDFTLNGANGCAVHNNIVNYGGFPGIGTGSAGTVA